MSIYKRKHARATFTSRDDRITDRF